jgi:hypothetical protein
MSYLNQIYYSMHFFIFSVSFCAKPDVDPSWDQNTSEYLLSESEFY